MALLTIDMVVSLCLVCDVFAWVVSKMAVMSFLFYEPKKEPTLIMTKRVATHDPEERCRVSDKLRIPH